MSDLAEKDLEELREMGAAAGVENARKLNKKTLVKRLESVLEQTGGRIPERVEADPKPEETEKGGERIHVHFVADGLTALGKLWYRGEELIVERDSEEFERTKDTKGNSWLDLTRREQVDRWGQEMFDEGPWPYAGWDRAFDPDENGAKHEDMDAEALKQAEKARQRQAPPPGYGARDRQTWTPDVTPRPKSRVS